MSDLEEAETWFATAKLGFDLEGASRARDTVVVAQCIHALIRGNDALSVCYLGRRSTRHEGAALLFGELVRQRKIPAKYAALRALLVRAISEKSEYEYKGAPVGRDTASRWLRDTERFLALVREILD